MNTQYQVGESYYFPLHGVGRVTEINHEVMRVNLHGIVAYIDFLGRPVYRDGTFRDHHAERALLH